MKWAVFVILCQVCVLKCLAMSPSELEEFSNFIRESSRLDQSVKSNIPDEYDEDTPASDHAWEESGKFEGDLILNDRQRRMIVASVAEGLARNGVTDTTKRWPNNEVVYYIQSEHFNRDQIQAIQDGIDDLARVSCVKFTPYKKGDRDAVVIQGSRRGCFSQVGYQGGYQILNLSRRHPAGRGCFRHGTVVHEMLHTLGFYHMQSSSDRDDYIDVIWANIVQNARHNFRKYNSFSVSDYGVGYDYDSVLHYSRKAFSVNGGDTLVPKQLGATIGQRIGLSEKDVKKLNRMYCDADADSSTEDNELTKTHINTKNKPFEGQGLGYQKGKTVIIKLPKAEAIQLQDPPQFSMFNYFSKATQELPPKIIQGIGAREEVIPGTYEIITIPKIEDYARQITATKTQEPSDNKEKPVVETNVEEPAAEEELPDAIDDDEEYDFFTVSEMTPQSYLGSYQQNNAYKEPYHFENESPKYKYSYTQNQALQESNPNYSRLGFQQDKMKNSHYSSFDEAKPAVPRWYNPEYLNKQYFSDKNPSSLDFT